MRKRSNLRKNSKRLNSNFFVFQGIMISLLLYLTWGSWIKFVIFIALEMTAYFAFIYYLLARQDKQKRKKKNIYSNEVYKRTKNNTREIVESNENNGLRVIGKNFDWEISSQSPEQKPMAYSNYNQDAPNKSFQTSNLCNSEGGSINNSTKSNSEEVRKFVPYRSPFEPIRPRVEEQKEETDRASELLETSSLDAEDMKFELIECKEENAGENVEDYVEDYVEDNWEEENVEEIIEEIIDEIIDENIEEKNNIPAAINEKKVITVYRPGRVVSHRAPITPVSAPVQSGKIFLDMADYETPVELLKKNEVSNYDEETEAFIEYNSHKLIETLASFGVGARVLNVSKGPTVTRYELQPNAGVKVSKIINLADDIALNLAATGVRIEAPIPGKAAVGIEIPNKKNVPVLLRDVIDTKSFQNYSSKLAFAVGKDIAGNVVVGDIAKMPHLLIAGATGSGKSVCINTLIISILYKASPAEVRLLMVDPKVVELGIYNGIPHLLIPVVTDPKKASGALTWAVMEMTNRYRLFAENNVRDLRGYNELIKERGAGETLPQIVIIIDELADLMMVAPNEVEDSICRLAQMARAAGMHLVIATQRPSVNVITGVIKANIPSRISFAVSSQIDSRTILDMAGAEKLLGRGDMLFYPLGQPKPLRVQGSFISDKEVERIVTHIKSLQHAEYDEEILQKIDNQTTETSKPDASGDDELLPQAIMMVLDLGQASASLIQRKFKVGYSRAARILDQMEAWGVVSASDGSGKPRQILITRQEWVELNA